MVAYRLNSPASLSSAPSPRSFCPALRPRVRQPQNRHSFRPQNRHLCGCFRSALTATGVSSSPVTIDVECTDAPQSLFTDVTVGYSKHTQVGGEASIRVYGKYPDNPDVDLTDSTLTTYATSSKGI